MKRFVFAILAAAAASASHAQGVAESAPSWNGLYLGANAGVLSGDGGTIAGTSGAYTPGIGPGWNQVGGMFTQAVPYISTGPNGTLGGGRTKGMTALMGGGQLGYNYQTGAVVWGTETDLQAVSPSSTSIATRERYNYFGTVRGRIGYLVMPNLLVFATGGFAYAERQGTLNVGDGSAVISRSSTKTGYTVGGGIEYALDQNWSVKGEGLYYDLGTSRTSGGLSPAGLSGVSYTGLFPVSFVATSQDRGVIGRVGLNYRFSGW